MVAKGRKYICKGTKGFISRSRFRQLSSSKRKQCRVIMSTGRRKIRR